MQSKIIDPVISDSMTNGMEICFKEKFDFLMNYYKVSYDVYSSHSSRIITIHGWSLTVLIAYLAFMTSKGYMADPISLFIGIGLLLSFNIIEFLERRYIHIYGSQLREIETIFLFNQKNEQEFRRQIIDFKFEMDKKSIWQKIIEIVCHCIKIRQFLWSGILMTILFVSYFLYPILTLSEL